jgi:transposase-like protein
MYPYRAADRQGQSVDSLLSRNRDVAAAKAFPRKAEATQGQAPRTMALDGYAASHRAVRELSRHRAHCKRTKRRSSKYPNNMIEQDH